MVVLQGGGQNLPSPCVCYPKDPMWNRVKDDFDRRAIMACMVKLGAKFLSVYSPFDSASVYFP